MLVLYIPQDRFFPVFVFHRARATSYNDTLAENIVNVWALMSTSSGQYILGQNGRQHYSRIILGTLYVEYTFVLGQVQFRM